MTTETKGSTGEVLVGIDLGTTFSLVACLEAGEARLIPDSLGELLTPSAVAFRGDDLLVGTPARARAVTRPDEAVFSFKRDMGTDRTYDLGSRQLDPVTASAQVLRSLKEDAERYLRRPVDAAVITVPAYFNELQRRATRDAARIAGLRVERLINEPTAAAIAYGLHQRHREVKVAILDLGGGTFDVTILEILEGVLEVQASAGDSRLGGDDFTQALADLVIEDVLSRQPTTRAPVGWPRTSDRARLFEAAEAAKKRLTGAEETCVVLPDLVMPDGVTADLDALLNRAEAEEVWASLLHRMEVAVVRAIGDAGVTAQEIDDVLLVGGASRMPCVARLAARIFGTMPLRNLEADLVVAKGAALQAGLHAEHEAVEDLVVTDIAPFSLGVATGRFVRGMMISDLFSPILDRGTVIPASRVQRFSTLLDGQTVVQIQVYQGEHSLVRDNRKLGELVIDDLRPAPAGEEAFDIRFTYDLNGLLEVEVTMLSTGEVRHLVLEDSPGKLSDAEIAQAREAMLRWKVHPRELLPNVVVLERAEALYSQLVGPERVELGDALATFRTILEIQDDREIEFARAMLLTVVDRYR